MPAYIPVPLEERRRLLLDPTLSYMDIASKVRRKVSTVAQWAWALHLGHLRSRTRKAPGVRFDPIRHPVAIAELQRAGRTVAEIQAATGLSRATLTHLARRHQIARVPGTRPKPKPRVKRTRFVTLKEFASC